MSTPKKIETYLAECLSEFCFSGYQLVASREGKGWDLVGGKTSHWPTSRSVTEHTYFDIGSLTKAVVTTSAIARAVDRNEIKLEKSLGYYDDAFKSSALGSLTLIDLLAHAAGVSAWEPIYKELGDQDLLAWFKRRGDSLISRKPGEKAVYSDIGMLLLGFVLKKNWGGIREAFEKEVREPLGLSEVSYVPLVNNAEVAATEFCLVRHRLLQGEVFDENTWALGGTSSHAGVFATAKGLVPWCEEWLRAVQGKSKWLSEKTAKLFTSRSDRAKESTWALGWDLRSKINSTAGSKLSLSSFGHLGYPGVSVWCDPEAKGFVIFLTNHIHPSRADERIRRIRPAVHNLVAETWGLK